MLDGMTTQRVPGPSTPVARAAPVPRSPTERWETFFRWGPYGLLAVASAISATTATDFMSPGQVHAAVVLFVAAMTLQLWWGAVRPEQPHLRSRAGYVYYVVRTALAFVGSLLNPFLAIYALIGYFEAPRLLPDRWVKVGLFTTAVTMAGSQSGGLPPQGPLDWVVFGAMFALNAGLGVIFGHLGEKEAEEAAAQAATITELERTNARLEQALAENAGLHAQLLVQAREAGVDDERRRLAAEIHDTLAQGLTGIITQLQAVEDTGDRALAREHLRRAQALARHSLSEARRSVQDLSPYALTQHALHEALEKAVAEWGKRTGVDAEFTVTGAAEPLHDEIEASLLRIAQESLANTARHARASRVGITLSYMDGEVTLDVRDDGRGFAPDAVGPGTASGGFGLGGMRARAERLAGRVDVESEPGQGTAVSVRVPLVRHG
jgi:signal transduction histidine kinase